ncbi:hypothetical protein DSCA_10250 [Desulfosarcina alkanivorans]|uniref:Uncharacterized protein n=1 Tax=Desulfosarcina alkanivorans TaxID=571177 RepID=A0A5K7YF51_9BACT|nr:hypothetical protein DSCA_10250 [Desulfosarcina alkanivorans]
MVRNARIPVSTAKTTVDISIQLLRAATDSILVHHVNIGDNLSWNSIGDVGWNAATVDNTN